MQGDSTSDYDFELPPELIAQAPAARRDESRLMVVERATGSISHARFGDLARMIPAGDALVLNATRVIRARLLGTRDSGAPAEVFLLRPVGGGDASWEAMVSPGGKLRPGRVVHVAPDLDVEILATTERRTRLVRLVRPDGGALDAAEALAAVERVGHVPLPPYIQRGDALADTERYQTVFAREPGSVAAPTAGLHFTPELLAALETRGVRRVEVVLHVGAGTFRPVDAENPAEHVMHEETWSVAPDAAATLASARAAGGKVWAVGTTSVRTLESAAAAGDGGAIAPGTGETRIFIRPPYAFRATDRLVTNFHLPRSTLLMLVAAFAGYEVAMEAYRIAVRERYRFYSYGDAMVVL